MSVAEDFPDDGLTLSAAVDFTGSGVSDLIYARREWGAWRVLANGNRLAKPFQGFATSKDEKDPGATLTELIPAPTGDLAVDNDLLAAVGDFLGNGTEQLAYTRPGCTQFWVVGAHGVVQLPADLKGIEANGPGARVHWLFPFKSRTGQHTRLAVYRMGCKRPAHLHAQGPGLQAGPGAAEGKLGKAEPERARLAQGRPGGKGRSQGRPGPGGGPVEPMP